MNLYVPRAQKAESVKRKAKSKELRKQEARERAEAIYVKVESWNMELRNTEKKVEDAITSYSSIASTRIIGMNSNRMNAWDILFEYGNVQSKATESYEIHVESSQADLSSDEISPKDFLTKLESLREQVISLKPLTKKFEERSKMVRPKYCQVPCDCINKEMNRLHTLHSRKTQ